MKRLLTSLIGSLAILAGLMTGLPAHPAQAAFCTVDPGGGGTYTTIQDAVDDAGCTAIGIFPGTYVENVSILRDVAISGAGQANTFVDGNLAGSVFVIDAGATVVIANLTMLNGLAVSGGGLYNLGDLTLDAVTITGNQATGLGGGLYNLGTLTAVDVSVDGNTAAAEGGGAYNLNPHSLTLRSSTVTGNSGSWGGGLSNHGALTVRDSVIAGNTAGERGGGVSNNGEATLTNTLLVENSAVEDGGGLYNYVNGQMQVIETTIRANASEVGGGLGNIGQLELLDSLVKNNDADYGGGIFHGDLYGGLMIVFDTTVTGNDAANFGGGIWAARDLTVVSSTISYNTASRGGGVDAAGVTIVNSTIDHNSALTDGGGIFMNDSVSSLDLDSTTVSLNTAGGSGGGIYFWDGTAELSNLTVARNLADGDADNLGEGGGLYQNAGAVTVSNSIVAANLDNSAATRQPDCAGTFTSGGYNLVGDGTGCAGFTAGVNGDQVGASLSPIDPVLGPLKDNAGPTFTHRLLLGSPAIDAGSGCPALDQRGLLRPADGNGDGVAACDIGALEHQ